MNSKELLEQADQRIAEAEQIKLIRLDITDLERLIRISQDDKYELKFCGEYDLSLEDSLSVDNYNGIKSILRATFDGYLNVQTVKLEQLLGITPKMVNPEFEAAIRGVEQSHKKPDPVEEKSTEIPKDEAKPIEAPEKSMEKYPAKKGGKKRLPESMTDEAVYQMLVIEGKKPKEIAEYYGLKSTQVSNFIFQHDIKNFGKRKKLIPKAEKPVEKAEKQPDDKESHSQPQQ